MLPWPDGTPVGLRAVLGPFDDGTGVRVKAEFGVSSALEEKVVEEIEFELQPGETLLPLPTRPMVLEGSVETTYRPRDGKPLVVGATPMGQASGASCSTRASSAASASVLSRRRVMAISGTAKRRV